MQKYKYCIRDLLYALEHVDNKYINWITGVPKCDNADGDNTNPQKTNEETNKDKSYCERVFAYELYHQYRKLMADNHEYFDLTFVGEQQKDNTHFHNLLNTIQQNKITPDLILHQYMGTPNDGGQIMYIEIKTVKNGNYYSDLKKLSDLSNSQLHFFYYIFIYVDVSWSDFIEQIKKDKEKIKQLDDLILCICLKDYKTTCKCLRKIKEKL